ncbi:hypothetical protein Uis1B_2000 [Bifidobacterium margollesii]|uniref:Uncharacterized protein n=1 Tax=Bifidobacterium margollesii TaxID=2020964 RepID=A0A2N5J7I4_9BIFI|nr:hypothetical protein Uis1B_2000 [Bifidobacterium margollesii]
MEGRIHGRGQGAAASRLMTAGVTSQAANGLVTASLRETGIDV